MTFCRPTSQLTLSQTFLQLFKRISLTAIIELERKSRRCVKQQVF